MAWNEDWLKANRIPASEHSKRYTLWPRGPARMVLTYFIIIILLDFLVLTIFGGQPIVIAGFPLLIWITVIFSLLTIAGILGFGSQKEDQGTPPVETPQFEDDESRSDQ